MQQFPAEHITPQSVSVDRTWSNGDVHHIATYQGNAGRDFGQCLAVEMKLVVESARRVHYGIMKAGEMAGHATLSWPRDYAEICSILSELGSGYSLPYAEIVVSEIQCHGMSVFVWAEAHPDDDEKPYPRWIARTTMVYGPQAEFHVKADHGNIESNALIEWIVKGRKSVKIEEC
jgi:hypothetical protein